MEEDRHLDGRACLAVASGVASLLVVFLSPEIGIFFAAFAWIFAGASVIAVDDDEPASPRTRRTALLALLPTLPALVALVLLLLTSGESGE